MEGQLYQSIYDSISELLLRATQDISTNTEYDALQSTVVRAVSAAQADSAQAWNLKLSLLPHRGLPLELVLKCFSYSSLPDRIRISCVSRGWRSIALADTTLWNDCDVVVKDAQDFDFIRLVLSRSTPLPLCIRLQAAQQFDDSVLALLEQFVRQHISRTRDLVLVSYHEPLNLERSEAPLLETIRVDGALILPTTPRLRRVYAMSVTFRDTQTVMNHFESFISSDQEQLPAHIFSLWPNLTHLELASYSQTPTLPRPPPPPHLVDLSIVLATAINDYPAMFLSCSNLHHVTLMGVEFPIIRGFLSTMGFSIYRVLVNSTPSMLMESEKVVGDAAYSIDWYEHRDHVPIQPMQVLMLHATTFETVQELEIPDDFLQCLNPTSIPLPHLKRMVVRVGISSSFVRSENIQFLAPALHMLKFILHLVGPEFFDDSTGWFTGFDSLIECLPATQTSAIVIVISTPKHSANTEPFAAALRERITDGQIVFSTPDL